MVKPNKVDYKISDNKKFGTVVIEPLEKGFGTTLGNALRRVLLSSLQGKTHIILFVQQLKL